MSKSIKLKNDHFWDSSSITYKRKKLSTILHNYMIGTVRANTVVNSYVRLFKIELSAIWKGASVIFTLSDTQSTNFSLLANLTIWKQAAGNELVLRSFKGINFITDVSDQLRAVVTSTNVVEVYFKMYGSQSPTLNIVSFSKLEDADNFGKLEIDMQTVIGTLPTGTTLKFTNIVT